MDHQFGVAHEIHEGLRNIGKDRFIFQLDLPGLWRLWRGQKVRANAMNTKGLRRHIAHGIDILVIGPSGWHVVVQLDRANLDNAVSLTGLETRGLGVQNNLTHAQPSVFQPDHAPVHGPRPWSLCL